MYIKPKYIKTQVRSKQVDTSLVHVTLTTGTEHLNFRAPLM